MVPTSGIEPLASPLPRECSTPELRGLIRYNALFLNCFIFNSRLSFRVSFFNLAEVRPFCA